MKLPTPIQHYFDADNADGADAPVTAFAPDAVVKDEGKTYVGCDAIQAWWLAAKTQYQQRAVPTEFLADGARTIVRAQVTGQFPGSPAPITFAFQLREGWIASLEIGA